MRALLLIGISLGLAACGEGGDRMAAGGAQPALIAPASAGTAPPLTRGGAAALAKVDRSKAGTPAPAAAFLDRAGKPVTLADFRGRPVLLNLWATWCAPCIAEMPALDRLQVRGEKTLTVLAVSQDLGGWRAVDGWAARRKWEGLRFHLDRENALALAYKARGLPLTVLYDARGREVWRLAGPAEWDMVSVRDLAPVSPAAAR